MMSNKILLGVLMASFSSMVAMADMQNQPPANGYNNNNSMQNAAAQPAPLHTLEGSDLYLAPAWQYLFSDEKTTGETFQGSMGGLSVGYDYVQRDSLNFKAEFTYMAGALYHSGSPHQNAQEYITEVDFGYDISSPFGEKFTMTPFVGIGYYIFNKSTVDFDSHFWYVPLGLSLEYRFDQSWALGLVGYGAPTFAGHAKKSGHINGSDGVNAVWDVQLPITYIGSLPFKLSLIPFAKGWGFEKKGDYQGNRQTYFGLKMLFGYHF